MSDHVLSSCSILARGTGVPELRLAPQIVPLNVWQRCPSGESEYRQQLEAMPRKLFNETWMGLEPKERYCSLDEYYAGQHAHCKAGIAAHFADDLQLLYGSR